METKDIMVITPLICVFIILSLGLNIFNDYGFFCKIRDKFNGKDLYCFHKRYSGWDQNLSYTPTHFGWEMRSHKEDERNTKIEEEYRRQAEEDRLNAQICYNKGYDYNVSFDILQDYKLTCKKIGYINDHLVDKVVNGGYIRGEYRGFLSHGEIEGQFNIIKRSLSKGQFVKNINGHVDCNNVTSNEVISYYDEADFVNYYVEKCIND